MEKYVPKDRVFSNVMAEISKSSLKRLNEHIF